MTTPFERDLLTHYFTRTGMFQRDRGRPSQLVTEPETKYIQLGLLRYNVNIDEIVGVIEALAVYMEALDAVPLPVCKWVIPQ